MHKLESTELGREKLRAEWKQNIETLKKTSQMVVDYSSTLIDSSKQPKFGVLKEEELEKILFEALKETRREINEGKVVKGEAIFHKGRQIEKVGKDPAEWNRRFIENVVSGISAVTSHGKKTGDGVYSYYLSNSCYEDGRFKFYF